MVAFVESGAVGNVRTLLDSHLREYLTNLSFLNGGVSGDPGADSGTTD